MSEGTKPAKHEGRRYEKISPTAWLTAYPRIFSDIPFSKEIFDELEKMMTDAGTSVPADMKVPLLAPELEARYKLTDQLLRAVSHGQVLEIAAGLSPRGLLMAQDQQLQYAELELPEMARLKREIIANVTKTPQNLHIVSGNGLNLSDLKKATEHFAQDKQITVVNEGLLRYLNFDEKARVAKNIHHLLQTFGGAWITPDITLKKFLEAQNETMPGKNQMMSDLTESEIDKNRFEDEGHARQFFEDLGFTIERHGFLEAVDRLVSPEKLNIPREEVEKMIGSAVVFVMRAKE